jgi:hypothetical protein
MNSFLRVLSLYAIFWVPENPRSQPMTSPSVLPVVYRQERTEKKEARARKPGDVQSILKATDLLKRVVNGNSVVKNQCQIRGRTAEVQENTEISEADGCNLIVRTVKTSGYGEDRRQLQFTVRASLADLTTPASVEPQTFSGCKPGNGVLLKVMSRVQPGKSIPTSRSSTAQAETAPARKDLSFFFSDAVIARRARALDHAVAACGGREWPDEDDLP